MRNISNDSGSYQRSSDRNEDQIKELTPEEILEHYQRTEIKEIITGYCNGDSSWRCANSNFSLWYMKNRNDRSERLISTDDLEYLLSLKGDRRLRTFYASLNLFEQELKSKGQPFKEDREKEPTLGGLEDTVAYSLSVDIDSVPPEDHDIHSEKVKAAVEAAAQFFVNSLKKRGINNSVHCLYSGGGAYVIIHHALCSAENECIKEKRAEYFKKAINGYNSFIKSVSKEFFETYKEHRGLVKFDRCNNRKRLLKTIFSIHKRLPYAVIPLNRDHIQIDFNKASLPISNEVIEEGKRWYREFDISEKIALEALWNEFYCGQNEQRILEQYESRNETKSENRNEVYRYHEQLPKVFWPPCIRKIVEENRTGEGVHRCLGILSSFLYEMGWSFEEARTLVEKVAENHGILDRMDIFRDWYGKMYCPICETILDDSSCYPNIGLGGLNYCLPDEICRTIRKPVEYSVSKEINAKSLKDLVERAKKDVSILYRDDVINALSILKENDMGAFEKILHDLKNAHITIKELNKEVTARIKKNDRNNQVLSVKYLICDNRLCTLQGDDMRPLCSFEARIVQEETIDDGFEKKKNFILEGTLEDGTSLSKIQVPASDFEKMQWVTSKWGAKANIFPRMREYVRSAIQYLSKGITQKEVYVHLGWRKIDGEWYFLHSGGAIGRDGLRKDIDVILNGKLKDYCLPDMAAEDIIGPNQASLKLLDLGDGRITFPLLAGVSLAPLGEILTLNFSIYIAGESGTYKTQLAALAQSHFGANWNGTNLPANWESSANYLEKLAFITKDVVLTVDDFHPVGTQNERQKMNQKSDRLLRGEANKGGRGRMKSDTSTNEGYYPRGLIISTGEDLPEGQSLNSRLFLIEIHKGDIDKGKLTEMQKMANSGYLAKSMSGYVQWIAANMDRLKEELPGRVLSLRNEFASIMRGTHARTPETAALLMVGWEMRLKFMEETGSITRDESKRLWALGKETFTTSAEKQSKNQQCEDPCLRFIEFLKTVFVMGLGHLVDANDGGEPSNANRWGWTVDFSMEDSERGKITNWKPSGRPIGWIDGSNVYLDPGASYTIAMEVAHKQGSTIPFKEKTLWSRLKGKRLLISNENDRNLERVKICGRKMSVVHLVPGCLDDIPEEISLVNADLENAGIQIAL